MFLRHLFICSSLLFINVSIASAQCVPGPGGCYPPSYSPFPVQPQINQQMQANSEIDVVENDVEWCINGDATYRIDQQPQRGYCPAVLAGTLVGAWYAPQYASYIGTRTQKQWFRAAIPLACSPEPIARAAAVGLTWAWMSQVC
jgi:hypothetical protein